MKMRLWTIVLLTVIAIGTACSDDPTPPSGNNALQVGGKINSASFANGTLTFSPSTEFFTALFYAGDVSFATLAGTGWQGKAAVSFIPENVTQSDGINDWSSPFDLAVAAGLEQGKQYTMLIFFTTDVTKAADQGTIVFTR